MRRVRPRRRAVLPVAALLAFAETVVPATTPASAQNIRVERNAGLDVTLTDNLNLEPDDRADSALILSDSTRGAPATGWTSPSTTG